MCSCVQIINPTRLVKARKNHKDNNREWIMEMLVDLRKGQYWGKRPTFKQWRLIAESIRDGWIIKKGVTHEYQVLKADGEIYQWRSKPGLNAFCQQYDLYPEC